MAELVKAGLKEDFATEVVENLWERAQRDYQELGSGAWEVLVRQRGRRFLGRWRRCQR